MQELPFADDSFEQVTAFETIYFWPNLEEAFQQVFRVLKPGGSFLVCNESNGEDPKQEKWCDIIGGMTIYTGERLFELLWAAGFIQVEIHQREDRNWLCVTAQKPYLFDESIRENIRMGRPAATDAEVEAVAKAAGCDAFIRSLEHGYDTVVGGGGAHLSGGERQRIAIARAMLKDAPIVVLDEATAYIDPENEAVVQQAVGKLVAGKTVLVIAHRLSTITGADQIVVVNGGRSQDVGTHGELLKNCPLYQEMWRAHMGAKEGEQA